ncbi:hypothetical protein OF829_05005 [Sphingomonas sp. LB-2]|uniref:hypothetical protein n=1 Tax=Sphingomonas caeni TaxID=2984949 RepID=UPI0022309CE8|nr:hypothetical protein [Sphingomonas caeni]MCW3846588.1 hypothetical protein [Sphingomonas caeni]
MTVDHPLLHDKPLAHIELELVWQDFPGTRGGLGKYYRGYRLDPPIRNGSFVVRVTAPLAGWTDSGRSLKLLGAGGRTWFELTARGAKRVGAMPLTLELVAPVQGFGDDAYPAAIADASLRAAQGERVVLPNPPWRAMVSRIGLRVAPA